MTHRCLIIEDDPNTAEDIKATVKSHFKDIYCLGIVDNIVDAKQIIDKQQPHLVISDINLKDDVVFKLLQQFETITFKIIFITSYSKYAVEAFKFSALDFLQKPFGEDELILAIKNALTIIDSENYTKQIQAFFHNYNSEQPKKKLVLKNVEAIHIVSVENIIYVKSDNNYSEFYISDGRKIVTSKPLKFYDEQLRSYSFFRTHQSYLVNLNFAKTYHKKDNVLELSNSEHVAVSGNKVNALIHYLGNLT